MNKWLLLLLLLCPMAATAQSGSDGVHVWKHNLDPSMEVHDYEVMVKPVSGGEWQRVPVLRCDVNTRKVQKAAFAEFDMAKPVAVRIRKTAGNGQCSMPVVRPSSRSIVPQRTDSNEVEIVISEPSFLSVEYDGDRHHNLHLFANSILTEHHTPDEPNAIDWVAPQSQDVFVKDAKLIYFGPGVHKPKDLPSAEIKIPSGCTVYLAPGAVVKARLIVDRAENVRIVGRGIIDHPLRGVEITYSRNVLVEGITFLNPAHYTIYGGESSDITVRGIKSFSARSWSDGVDLMCCKRVKVENCFLRTSDDCIALYNHRWWYWGGSEDIEVSRCVFWPDVAHSVNIGSHGDDRNPEGETLRNVTISDCDILYNKGEGVIAINCGDRNHIKDITFDNIRVEGIEQGRLFDLQVLYSEKYNRAPGCCVDSVTISNITVDEESASILLPSRITDHDSKCKVKVYELKNIKLGNRPFDANKDIEHHIGNPL